MNLNGESTQVSISAIERRALEEGRVALIDKYVEGWHFEHYAPKVTDEAGQVLEFAEWYDAIVPQCFPTDDMLDMFGAGEIGFEEFKWFLVDGFKDFYAGQVAALSARG